MHDLHVLCKETSLNLGSVFNEWTLFLSGEGVRNRPTYRWTQSSRCLWCRQYPATRRDLLPVIPISRHSWSPAAAAAYDATLYLSVLWLLRILTHCDNLPSVLWHFCIWLGVRNSIRPVKIEWWCAVMWQCDEGETDRHTDGRDQYTSRLGYASREMSLTLWVHPGASYVFCRVTGPTFQLPALHILCPLNYCQ